MRRILTLCLTLHWTIAFSLLSFWLIRGVGQNEALPLYWVGDGSLVPALLTVALFLVSALFLWAFLIVLSENSGPTQSGEETIRTAFAAAVSLMTVFLIVLAFEPQSRYLLAAAMSFAALLASYIVIALERGSAPKGRAHEPIAAAFALDRGMVAGSPAKQSAIIYPFPEKER